MESNQPPESTVPDGPAQDRLDLNKPCKITNVNFQGVKRTRPTLLAKMVSDIFSSNSLIDLLERYVQVKENLLSLKAFSSIDLEVNPAKSPTLDGSNNDENYEVTLIVEEKGPIGANAQTMIDNYSTHISFGVSAPNLSGVGDYVLLSSKFNKRFYSTECSYSIPLLPWKKLWNPRYNISYSHQQYDASPSGYDQEDRGIINRVDFFSLPQLNHSISFENIWRYLKPSSRDIPIEVREQCGHSVKSSIKHQMTYDTREEGETFYSGGIVAKLTNEITTNLVNGGIKLIRNELQLQYNALLLPKYDLLFQANLLAGTLCRAQKIALCDKFFAGGPLTLRGFKLHGLAPTIHGYPLGDLSYLSAGAHLYSILPFTRPSSAINNFLRPHIFVNTGTIGNICDIRGLTNKDNIERELLRFKDSLRYSCGFGLVFVLAQIRLELNYCVPLIFKENDLSVRGMQWGFGMTYS